MAFETGILFPERRVLRFQFTNPLTKRRNFIKQLLDKTPKLVVRKIVRTRK